MEGAVGLRLRAYHIVVGVQLHPHAPSWTEQEKEKSIDLGLCLLFLQAQEGDTHFTELAKRVEYGNYVSHTII